MADKADVNLDTSNETADDTTADNVVSDTVNNEDTQDTSANEGEDVEKLKELNKKLYERTKKAEAEVKALKKPQPHTPVSEPSANALSPKEIALLGKIHEDDMDEVIDHANYKKIPIGEVLKSPYIQSFLKDREEERKSAQVANTGGSRRSSTTLTPEQVIANARKGGQMKEEDWKALHEARAKGF
jgi:hypothetical protein